MPDELTDAFNMADEECRKLRALAPDNELLKYDVDCLSDHPELHTEFRDRFWDKPESWKGKPGYPVNTYCCAQYVAALRAAIIEAEAKK